MCVWGSKAKGLVVSCLIHPSYYLVQSFLRLSCAREELGLSVGLAGVPLSGRGMLSMKLNSSCTWPVTHTPFLSCPFLLRFDRGMSDLDAYVSRYSGYTRIRRLDWISQRCPELASDCYRTVLSLLRHGINTAAYREMCARARQVLGPEYAEDTEWVAQVRLRPSCWWRGSYAIQLHAECGVSNGADQSCTLFFPFVSKSSASRPLEGEQAKCSRDNMSALSVEQVGISSSPSS